MLRSPPMKIALKLLVTLAGSAGSVYLQARFVSLDQWVIMYAWIFICAWLGGMYTGMFATITCFSLAGVFLLEAGGYLPSHIFTLLILIGLGFWVSFTMEKYKIERELARNKGFLDSLIDNIPLMVYVKDAEELRFRNFNEYGLRILNMKREEIIGKSDFDFCSEASAEKAHAEEREILRKGKVHDIPVEEFDFRDKGKILLHTRKIPILDEKGKPLYLLGVAEDITEKMIRQKKAALELQDEAARRERQKLNERESVVAQAISTLSQTLDYQEAIRGIVKAVVPSLGDWSVLSLVNEDGVFGRTAGVHQNPALQKYLDEFIRDFPPEAEDLEVQRAFLTGEPTLERVVTDEELESLPRHARKRELYKILGTNSSVIIPVRTRDGILGVLGISRGQHRGPFDELDFALAQEIGRRAGTILDNTILFQSTQRAVRARDEFLSIASHELKTPITSLRLQLEMLLRPGRSGDLSRPIQNAVNQIDRLTALVNDLLDVGRLESGKLKYDLAKTGISEIVREVSDAMRPQFMAAGAELIVDVEDEAFVSVDRYRMEQVIVNLLNNALKYGMSRPVRIGVTKKSSQVQMTVSDEGVGIAESQITRIFGKFERGGKVSSIAGLGLGLYITSEIVKAFQGTITVRSEEGKGTEFTVLLPGA